MSNTQGLSRNCLIRKEGFTVKKFLCLILIAFLFTGMCFPVIAADNTENTSAEKESLQEVCAFLTEQFSNNHVASLLNEDMKMQLVEAFEKDPDSFYDSLKIQTTTICIDEFASIEYIINTPNEVLLKQGATEEEIFENRQYLVKLSEKTNEELATEFSRSVIEINLLREALTPDERYTQKNYSSDIVTSSGTLSTNNLIYDMGAIDQSATKKTPYAIIIAMFEWKKTPVWAFTDTLAFCWGGGMASKDFSMGFWPAPGSAYYGKVDEFNFSWAPDKDGKPNAGVLLEYDIQATRALCGGGATFLLYNTGKLTGNTAEIITKYAHKKLAWGDVSLTWPPGINITISHDATPAVEQTVKY